MTLTLEAVPVPLRLDERGAYRIGNSQVLLDVLVREFNCGMDPDSIARAYPTLCLADTYAAIAYYLSHRDEVDLYIQGRALAAEALWKQIQESQEDRGDIRAILLARRASVGNAHAVPDNG